MEHSSDNQHGHAVTERRIPIPPIARATPEELARRREVIAEIHRIREEIGPIGMNAVDLIDADFYDLDAESR